MSDSVSSTAATAAAATSSAVTHTIKAPTNLKVVGVILAVVSGLLIGASFVFKKKGLLRSQAGGELGEGVAYLKSALWWIGMIMMILGEICNFAAYAFVEAIVVTPLGALSVVVCAILSSLFLNEKLSFFGWLGCGLCILGSVIIALNGPKEETIGQIKEFQKLFLAPGFLAFISVLITASLVIVLYFAPKYGKKSMLWYISVCSMIGGISVSVTTGLGAAIVQSAMGDNQFKHWFMYFLLAFVVITLLVEVYYLNVALALFNTAMVTPTYYVIFTFCSMVTTVVLFQGLHASVTQIITIVMAFLVICFGITILQMSKVDPEKLSDKLDRRSTILLQAARSQTETLDEKGALGVEDPGMDALRGSFGTVGSIIRARTVRRMSQSSQRDSHLRMRPPGAAAPYDGTPSWLRGHDGMTRHQLYDAPMPRDDASSIARAESMHSALMSKRPTIKFDKEDMVHSYSRPGDGELSATHQPRQALAASLVVHDGYPPLPPLPPGGTRNSNVSEGNLLGVDVPDVSRMSGLSNFAKSSAPNSANTTTPTTASTNATVTPRGNNPGLVISPPAAEEELIPISQLIETEHAVHSAPPTLYGRFGATGANAPRVDSRNVFNKAPSTARADSSQRGTLLSFPSVTDSAPSQWDPEERERRQKELEMLVATSDISFSSSVKGPAGSVKERSRERGNKKKYPGAKDDEGEEAESLWHKQSESVDSHELPGGGSIRLIPPKPSYTPTPF
ncbi:hypothetical protein CVT24_007333 [Panaeolus cyanescens]|uniref:DUF803-domain-containing protein n=1 Tax=Panaeolus cyanescens TaxID=181874 RepID=A0A409W5A9_9AGAR|nr:hypothetical protein CVT24_007333 [Panaeolus cyanescens]